jgi:hypothetical protein
MHHTKAVLNSINASTLTANAIKNASSVTIVKTINNRCSGTSGMQLICKLKNIPYDLETVSIQYNKSWIDGVKKFKFEVNDDRITQDTHIDEDKYWMFKLGYTDYINTPFGPKQLLNIPVNKSNNAKKGMLTKIISAITKLVTQLYNKIKEVIFGNTKSRKSKNKRTKNANTLINTTLNITPHIAACYISTLPKNASYEIKRANKVIAGMQINKMLAKSGVSGNKTLLNEKRSPAMDAYIAGMTSFNTTDAITMANNMATTRYKVHKSIITCIVLMICLILLLFIGNPLSAIIGITLFVTDYYTEILPGNLLTYTISLIMSTNFLQLIINVIALGLEKNISDSKTAKFRSLTYFTASCLALLI